MELNSEKRADRLVDWYGDGKEGSSPTREQWLRLLEKRGTPVTFINFFKMRAFADYQEGVSSSLSGQAAFDQYAAVSVPTVEKVGGKFLLLAPFEASFIGAEEIWDLVAVGSYPTGEAALDLYENENYREAYKHRLAAVSDQKVLLCLA